MSYTLLTCVDSKVENSTKFYGRFELGPFAPGQGLTVANALRRSLLSQVSGIAITLLEIEGASHEYEILNGIRESILDITLNLKEVVLTSDFEIFSPQVGFLNVKGPGKVCASDLKLPSFIYVVDPDQYIATLTTDGRLNMKFLICCGKNYITHNPDGSLYSEWFLKLKKAKPLANLAKQGLLYKQLPSLLLQSKQKEALSFKDSQTLISFNSKKNFKAVGDSCFATNQQVFVNGNALKAFAGIKDRRRLQKGLKKISDSQKSNLKEFKFLMVKKKKTFNLFLPLFLYQWLFHNSYFANLSSFCSYKSKIDRFFYDTEVKFNWSLTKNKLQKKENFWGKFLQPLAKSNAVKLVSTEEPFKIFSYKKKSFFKGISTSIPYLKKDKDFLVSQKEQKTLKKEILTLNFYQYWKKERDFLNTKINNKNTLSKSSNPLTISSTIDNKIRLILIKKNKLNLLNYSEISNFFKEDKTKVSSFVFLNKFGNKQSQKPRADEQPLEKKPFDLNNLFSEEKLEEQKKLKSNSGTESELRKKNSDENRIVNEEIKPLINEKNSSNSFQIGVKKRGYFPIDAVFMPVIKVNYLIESTGFKVPKDLIILEIWTNGSIHPRKAIHKATKSLIKLFLPLQQFQKNTFSRNQLKKRLKTPVLNDPKSDWNSPRGSLPHLSNSRQKKKLNQILQNKKGNKSKNTKNVNSLKLLQRANYNLQISSLDLANLKLTAQLFSSLKKANIHTIAELIGNSKNDLLSIKGLEPNSVLAIENSLFKINLSLKEDPDFSE